MVELRSLEVSNIANHILEENNWTGRTALDSALMGQS
jgi:hypothetical protein